MYANQVNCVLIFKRKSKEQHSKLFRQKNTFIKSMQHYIDVKNALLKCMEDCKGDHSTMVRAKETNLIMLTVEGQIA